MNLLNLMKKQGITTTDLANKLDIPEEVIQYWINHGVNNTDPCYPKLKKLFPELISVQEDPRFQEYLKTISGYPMRFDPHILYQTKYFYEEDQYEFARTIEEISTQTK